MDWEADGESGETEAVRGSRVVQTEPADAERRAENRLGRLPLDVGEVVRAVPDYRPHPLLVRGEQVPRLAGDGGGADVEEEGTPNTAEDADWRRHRLDEREPQLHVAVKRLVAQEVQIFVAAHLRLSTEEDEVGKIAPTVEGAPAERQDPVLRDPQVVAGVEVDCLTGQEPAESGGVLVARHQRVAGDRAVLAEDGRLLKEARAERHEGAVAEERGPELLLLERIGLRLQRLVCERLLEVVDPGRELDPPEAVDRIDADGAPAVRAPRGDGVVAAQERETRGEVRAETVEVLLGRNTLQGVLQPPRQVHVGRPVGSVGLDRVGLDVEHLVAEHVGEADHRAAEHIAAVGQAEAEVGAALHVHVLEATLAPRVGRVERVGQRRLKIDQRARTTEVGSVGRIERLVVLDGMESVLRPEVGDEADAGEVGVLVRREDDRVDDPCRVVGELMQRAVLQIQRPEVEDLPVPGGIGIDRLRRVDGRRREHDGAFVEKLPSGFVVGPERQLTALPGFPIDPEQLVVAADPRQVDDGAAIRRIERRVVGQRAVGEVRDLPGLQVDLVDVTHGAVERGKDHRPSVGREVRRFRLVDHVEVDQLLDLSRDDVLNGECLALAVAHDVRESIAVRRP